MFNPLYAFGIARQNHLLRTNDKNYSGKSKKKRTFVNVSEIIVHIGCLLIKAGERLKGNSAPYELHKGTLSIFVNNTLIKEEKL